MTHADKASRLVNLTSAAQYALAADGYLDALDALGMAADVLTDLAADVAQSAFDAGTTKKAIAAALNVPPSTFRGMVRQGAA